MEERRWGKKTGEGRPSEDERSEERTEGKGRRKREGSTLTETGKKWINERTMVAKMK